MASDPLIRFHPEARAELEAASVWYERRSQAVLDRFVAAIEHALQLIHDFPDGWPKVAEADLRHITISRTPYSLIYQVLPEIIILAVAHGRRKPNYWRERA